MAIHDLIEEYYRRFDRRSDHTTALKVDIVVIYRQTFSVQATLQYGTVARIAPEIVQRICLRQVRRRDN